MRRYESQLTLREQRFDKDPFTPVPLPLLDRFIVSPTLATSYISVQHASPSPPDIQTSGSRRN